jgi:hypothetical protein
MGNDLAKANKEFKSLARDFDRYGLGGGDSTLLLYEYTGRPMFFRDIYTKWKQDGDSVSYNKDLTELGFDLNTLQELNCHYC